jgi:hypothetical protein
MKMKTQLTTPRIDETNSWFLEKIIKIHKPLAKLTKKDTEDSN